MQQVQVAWACCGAGSLAPDGTAANTYRLGGGSATLHGLQAKPVGAAAFRAGSVTAQAAQRQSQADTTELGVATAAYVVHWQARSAADALPARRLRRQYEGLHWSNGRISFSGKCQNGKRSSVPGAAAVFQACQRSLRFVQQHMPGDP